MADPVTSHDDVTEAVRRFEEAEQTTADARSNSERDRDYYDGKQWTEAETSALEKRGQPVVTFNRIQRKINYLKGLEAQTRKDPKCFPRTPGDDGAAQAATDALRFVCEDQQWDSIRSEAFESIMVEGTGAVFVGAAQGKQGIDPTLIQIPWDRFYSDPFSRRPDFSDATYMGIVTWLDFDEAVEKWGDRAEIIESTLNRSKNHDTYDDRPKSNLWADYKRKRVRFCEEYYLVKGVWHRCVFTQGGWVEDPEPSPFLDEDGKPENPIKAISAYVDRDNNRYGEVRAMISPQDEVNKRRSKGLHLINSRQARVSRSAWGDVSQLKRELAKPDGMVMADKDEFEVIQTGDMAALNLEMLQEAKAEIDLLGPNAALAGKNENDQSGRALLAQQQGGMVEVALLMDRLRHLSLAVYRAIWARIRQYWQEERWIRVTDDERNLKWVGLNAPKTMLEIAAERLQGDPQAEMKLALLARDPRAQMVMEVKNPVAEIDVDIVIDEGMDTPMVQAEQFTELAKIMPSIIQLPTPYAKMLIQASSLRDKDKILETIEQIPQQIPPEVQKQLQEMQQAIQQLGEQNMQLKMDIEGKQADRQLKGAEIELKGREIVQADQQIEVDAYRAETERMEAMKPEPKREAA